MEREVVGDRSSSQGGCMGVWVEEWEVGEGCEMVGEEWRMSGWMGERWVGG